jgi:hypothetical protein
MRERRSRIAVALASGHAGVPPCFGPQALQRSLVTFKNYRGFRLPHNNVLRQMTAVDRVEKDEGAYPHGPSTRWPQQGQRLATIYIRAHSLI